MKGLADREIIDLFRERPDLLAVADAVASTQADAARPAPRSLPRLLAVPAFAAAAAVVLLFVAAPWNSDSSSVDARMFFQRALAVVGSAPVLHVVFEDSSHETVVVATGEERPRVRRTEIWYDADRGLARFRLSVDGRTPADYIVRNTFWTVPDPAFRGFTTRYRDALASGSARIVGDAEVNGRSARIIEFTPPGDRAAVEQVTVDAETFTPLTVTYTSHQGRSSTVLHVLRIESLPYRPKLFPPSKVRAEPPSAISRDTREISVAEATRALGRVPLGLDRAPDSLELEQTEVITADGRHANGTVIELAYGDLKLSEARGPAGVASLGIDPAYNPVPPEGSVAIWAGAERSFAWLQRDGVSVWLRAPSKDQVLDAARALQPLK